MFDTYVTYKPGSRHIEDVAIFKNGKLVPMSGKGELNLDGFMFISLDQASELIDDIDRELFNGRPWTASDKSEFWYLLECLPPKRWTNIEEGEFFFLGEASCSHYHLCAARIGESYYTKTLSIYTPDKLIIEQLQGIEQ